MKAIIKLNNVTKARLENELVIAGQKKTDILAGFEVWVGVPGFDAYEISSWGNVRSLDRKVTCGTKKEYKKLIKGMILEQPLLSSYPRVNLTKYDVDGRPTAKVTHYVHRLMIQAFLGVVSNHYTVIDHSDSDKLNNHISNISPVTARFNSVKEKVLNPSLNGSSSFIGVSWSKKSNKWISRITIKGVQQYLGSFKNEAKAAAVYNLAVMNQGAY